MNPSYDCPQEILLRKTSAIGSLFLYSLSRGKKMGYRAIIF